MFFPNIQNFLSFCLRFCARCALPWRTIGARLFPASYLDWAVSEWRPVVMEWYWMVPKADS